MSQTTTPHKHQQRPVEDILDFCTLTLAGMSIGFVLSFVAAHYIRGWRLATSHGYVPGGRRR